MLGWEALALLPRAVGTPSLEAFKAEWALGSLSWWGATSPRQGVERDHL